MQSTVTVLSILIWPDPVVMAVSVHAPLTLTVQVPPSVVVHLVYVLLTASIETEAVPEKAVVGIVMLWVHLI